MMLLNKLFKKKPTNIIEQTDGNHTWQLEHIYTDSFSNKWYQLIDSETLPARRFATLDLKLSYLEIGVDSHTIDKVLDMNYELAQQERYAEIKMLNDLVRERMSLVYNERNMLDIGCSLYTINEEKIYQDTEYYNKVKLDILTKDQDAKDFFLGSMFELSKRLSTKYSEFTNISLADLQKKEAALKYYFGNIMDKLASKKSTK